jgi:hypothetical protein
MLRRSVLPVLGVVLALALVSSLHAVGKTYSTGTLTDVQQKSKDRVDLYLVNTPVTTPVPYFEVTVELGEMRYVANYTPRHAEEELPEAWKAGAAVQARVEKHFIYLKRQDGSELQFVIARKTSVSKQSSQ